MPSHQRTIWLDFDLTDTVRHKEFGEGEIVEYVVTERKRGSANIVRGSQDVYYIVSFNGCWKQCSPGDLQAVKSDPATCLAGLQEVATGKLRCPQCGLTIKT